MAVAFMHGASRVDAVDACATHCLLTMPTACACPLFMRIGAALWTDMQQDPAAAAFTSHPIRHFQAGMHLLHRGLLGSDAAATVRRTSRAAQPLPASLDCMQVRG